jgi:hypothetical protein
MLISKYRFVLKNTKDLIWKGDLETAHYLYQPQAIDIVIVIGSASNVLISLFAVFVINGEDISPRSVIYRDIPTFYYAKWRGLWLCEWAPIVHHQEYSRIYKHIIMRKPLLLVSRSKQ